MYLASLRLKNWRNIEDAQVRLDPSVTVFVGGNAQGKTNILEAVNYLATASSHRTRQLGDLVRWGQTAAHISGEVLSGGILHVLECGLEGGRRILRRDGQDLARVGDLYGTLRITLFAWEDLGIVTGGPEARRRFLDMIVAQLQPGYIRILQQYRRAVRQRNNALHSLLSNNTAARPSALLDVWDSAVARLGGEVVTIRQQAVKKLAPIFESRYEPIAEETGIRLVYKTRLEGTRPEEISQSILDHFHKHRSRDIQLGATSVGPHRDDMTILLGNRPLATFGSQGQQRTAVLALRLAQAELLARESGEPSVLLVDDVVYELDRDRRRRFWESIPAQHQALVTTTDHRDLAVGRDYGGIYHVKNGCLDPA